MKRLLMGILLACGVQALSAASVACESSFRQNWPWDARLFIDVTMPEGTNDLSLVATFNHDGARVELELTPGRGLKGPTIYGSTGGVKHLSWDPVAAGYTKALTDFSLTARAVPAEDRAWLVIDMATGASEYYAKDAAPVNDKGWPWQDSVYKNGKMVFRRVPAGTFTMGYTDEQIAYLDAMSPAGTAYMPKVHQVELTSDFYLGIYPVTYGQIRRLEDSSSVVNASGAWVGDKNVQGGGSVCFQRGSNDVEGVSWPTTKFTVTPDSWVGRFRARCGNKFMIDLATAAQWQRAMRPDPQWLWYEVEGLGGGAVGDSAETITNVLDAISQIPSALARGTNLYSVPSSVGQKQPNALGFYDSVGARPEIMLDQWNWDLNSFSRDAVDPVGPTNNPKYRVSFNSFVNSRSLKQWSMLTISSSTTDHDLNSDTQHCFRYAIHLNPPASFNGTWE